MITDAKIFSSNNERSSTVIVAAHKVMKSKIDENIPVSV